MIAERLEAQLLAGPPAPDPLAVAERLLAIQAQDPRGARLAIRARSSTPTVAEVDRALTEDRSLVVSWLNRGTLHLVRSEDYGWLHALTTPPLLTGVMRRLSQEGVSADDADRGVAAIERALTDDGPLTRPVLRERVAAAGVGAEGQATPQLLALATLRGLIVRGPLAGNQHAFALVADWLGPTRPVDRERALAELARRYLAGHGPATDRDLAGWAGLPLRDARAGLEAIAGQLSRRDGLVDLAGREPAEGPPPPRLLGAFEPLLLGWASREAVVGEHGARIVSGGVFRPLVLVGGRVAGCWRLRSRSIETELFARLDRRTREELDRDAERILSFLGLGPT